MTAAERLWPGGGPLHLIQGTGSETQNLQPSAACPSTLGEWDRDITWGLLPAQGERYPLALTLAARPEGQGREEGEGGHRSESKAAAQGLPA